MPGVKKLFKIPVLSVSWITVLFYSPFSAPFGQAPDEKWAELPVEEEN